MSRRYPSQMQTHYGSESEMSSIAKAVFLYVVNQWRWDQQLNRKCEIIYIWCLIWDPLLELTGKQLKMLNHSFYFTLAIMAQFSLCVSKARFISFIAIMDNTEWTN